MLAQDALRACGRAMSPAYHPDDERGEDIGAVTSLAQWARFRCATRCAQAVRVPSDRGKEQLGSIWPREKGETHMNKAQVAGIVAGVTVGLLGVAIGVALAREEGREAARKWLEQSGELAQKGQQRAVELGQQARKTAVEQAPKVQERLNTIISTTAPQAADVLNKAMARTGLNGKTETAQA